MTFERQSFDLEGIETVGDVLASSARRHPRKTALICGADERGFATLDRQSNQFADALLARGLAPGAKIAIMCGNANDYVAAHFGAARTGAVLVHLSVRFTPGELAHMLNLTAAEILLVDARTHATFAAARADLTKVPALIGIGGDLPGGVTGFAEFIDGRRQSAPDIRPGADEAFCILATGGTTGRPKGAIASHRARLISAAAAVEDIPLSGTDIVGVTTPLGHAAGLFTWLQPALQAGATCVLMAHWNAAEFIAAARRHAITAAFVVPVQLRNLLDAPEFSPQALASVRRIVCGGAETADDLIGRFEAALPAADLVLAYGSTEAGHLICQQPAERRAKPGTLGNPGPRIELGVFMAPGRPAATGEVGEIATRGCHLMAGYLDEPEQTAEYFRSDDGWGWTGDLGSVDEDGTVTLRGRSKEIIVSGGLNIYPVEIENALLSHPDIADCAVFGMADETWGELPAAAVVIRRGAHLDAAEIIEYSAALVAKYKRLRFVELVTELPRTAGGKLRRNQLRETYSGG